MSKIEWTDQTWNPIIGCSKVSPGCDNCYAEKMAYRQTKMRPRCEYGRVLSRGLYMAKPGWNGKTALVESMLKKPMNRNKPTKYFICSMGDLFHESVPFEWVDRVFAVMALCPQHTFQILTKRPERMAEYLTEYREYGVRKHWWNDHKISSMEKGYVQTLPNVWVGCTIEN